MVSETTLTLAAADVVIFAAAAIVLGLVLLVKGGNYTVDGATAVAQKFGMPPAIIGFTIIAFGTSLPELIVSVNANLSGYPDLAMGNVVGSNIANILFILALSAVIAPLVFSAKGLIQDLFLMLGATLGLVGLTYIGMVERWHGAVMVAVLIAYLLYKIISHKGDDNDAEAIEDEVGMHFNSMAAAWGALIVGLIALSLGSEVLVRGAVQLAEMLGVPEAVIGLTIVAFGTSLPELAVAAQAARKNHHEIVIGNVVGSNAFNVLSIIGIASLVKPIPIAAEIMQQDMLIMLAVTVLFVGLVLILRKVHRLTGILMFAGYLAYIAMRYV